MSEVLGNLDDMNQVQFDAEFVAMMGFDQELLNNAPLEAGIGATATAPEVIIIDQSEDGLVEAFARRMDESAMSMTPQELANYYSHIDTTLNRRLVNAGFNAIDNDEAERRANMEIAIMNANAVMASRRAYDNALAYQALEDEEAHATSTTKGRRTSGSYPKSKRSSSRPGAPAIPGRQGRARRSPNSSRQSAES